MVKKLLVILFGIIFVGVGIFLVVSGNDKAKRCTTEAVGTVIEVTEEIEESSDAETSRVEYIYTYFPVIEYTAGDKILSEKYSVGSGNKDKYKIGDKIDILYDKDKPEDYLIKGDKSSNILGIIFIVAGAVVAVIGIVKKGF